MRDASDGTAAPLAARRARRRLARLAPERFPTDSSDSEEDSVSEILLACLCLSRPDLLELDEDGDGSESGVVEDSTKYLLCPESTERNILCDPQTAPIEAVLEAAGVLCPNGNERTIDAETQARLEAVLEAAGIGKLPSGDEKYLADSEILQRLTSSVSCALDEAAAALTRMRSDQPKTINTDKSTVANDNTECVPSLAEACSDGDVGTVRKLLTEGRSVHETTEEGESLLSLACSAGYYELAQVLIAMHANVEDRGIKGDCTPLMEAASAGHHDIVRLLIANDAEVNAQSSSGNTPLMYGCAGGHELVVKALLEAGANVEDHNENGHTPLMEAASNGHVGVAKILLEHGAGINTHSNEFKESALTLACYKGHIEMVKFLLDAGADQEHKTDEMHTALMEASMDGHVEVARLLLDSGAQVNMPTDSFESPLTLAACGGHVELAMLLLERGANIEEVNDEGYTPLMEAAREGHEEMVALLLNHGANINAQTEETQETALTLACCGGFLEVADFLIKHGADMELGASTPLMEAAQEGHLELVRYLLETAKADVHVHTQTGDTALTYAAENGHTDVCDLLLQYGADLEHESEGGRTPLMKACRAGHLCTVKFLVDKKADVNKSTTNNDHTPLSLACAGGHLDTVKFLLTHAADPFHKLKDNSTMLIEAAKGGHTAVVECLLDYPHSIMMAPPPPPPGHPPHQIMHRPGIGWSDSLGYLSPLQNDTIDSSTLMNAHLQNTHQHIQQQLQQQQHQQQIQQLQQRQQALQAQSSQMTTAGGKHKTVVRKPRFSLSSNTPVSQEYHHLSIQDLPYRKHFTGVENDGNQDKKTREEQIFHKQRILEELQRVERELNVKGANGSMSVLNTQVDNNNQIPLELDIAQTQGLKTGLECQLPQQYVIQHSQLSTSGSQYSNSSPHLTSSASQVSQNTAIQDRPKAKPVSKKDAKNARKLVGTLEQSSNLKESLQQRQIKQQLSTQNQQSQQQQLQQLQHQQQLHHQQQFQQQHLQQQLQQHQIQQLQQQHLQQQVLLDQQTAQLLSQQQLVHQEDHLSKIEPSLPHTSVSSSAQLSRQQMQLLPNLQQQQVGIVTNVSVSPPQTKQQNQTSTTNTTTTNNNPMTNFAYLNNVIAHLQKNLPSLLTIPPMQLRNIVALILQQKSHEIIQESGEKLSVQDQQARRQLIAATADAFAALAATNAYNSGSGSSGPPSSANSSSTNILQPPSTDDAFNLDDVATAVAAASEQDSVEIANAAGSLEEALEAIGPLEGSLPSPLESALQSLGPLEALQTIPHLDGSLHGMTIPQELVEYYSLACNNQASNANIQCDRNTMQSLNPMAVLKRLHDQPELLDIVLETEPQKSDILDSMIFNQLTPPAHAPLQLAQSTQTQSHHHHHVIQGQQYMTNQQFTTNSIGQHQQQIQSQQPLQQQQQHAAQQLQHVQQQMQQTNQQPQAAVFTCIDVDSETDSNHDTALTLACAGGHEELVELLLSRGADIEHRDKKGFTPLILAATAGHEKVVDILLTHGADIEAQSERTKDTPLSLACSGGRYEVVELVLNRGANKEHRNVSDYTPLSLAASGGYVNIIRLLLSHQAEINSRTGSKLGISPLMLAAMNGHTAAVRLLLDMGSDINAQIETNRNTALTLACFQGRHEVVSLLLDRKANVEHRAKTGLTPLMEAASGGYVDVGRVLIEKGADVNATPVPSSRDTALTIAADKGHARFVELLLQHRAAVEVKNKKGNSPLWLAANGGHLSVVEMLYTAGADIDSQDNRKVSCLMAAFRKGHVKTVKFMVNVVTQFPSDQEMTRYICTLSDKELLEKCHECVRAIRAAKETQAAKANKNASILLEELDQERTREETKRLAAARRRERKKKKKLEKKEEKRKFHEEVENNEYNEKNEVDEEDSDREETISGDRDKGPSPVLPNDKEEGDSGIDANSQGSCSSTDVKSQDKSKNKKKKKSSSPIINSQNAQSNSDKKQLDKPEASLKYSQKGEVKLTSKAENKSGVNLNNLTDNKVKQEKENVAPIASLSESSKLGKDKQKMSADNNVSSALTENKTDKREKKIDDDSKNSNMSCGNSHMKTVNISRKGIIFESSRLNPADRDDFEATGNETVFTSGTKGKKQYHYSGDIINSMKVQSPKQTGKREDEWKEVVRKSNVQVSSVDPGTKKVSVPLNAISRVIGRAGSNINAIRAATGAHIEVEKQSKGQGERTITIKGSSEATKQAHNLIATMIRDPDVDIMQMLPRPKPPSSTLASCYDKTHQIFNVKTKLLSHPATTTNTKGTGLLMTTSSGIKPTSTIVVTSNMGPISTPGKTPGHMFFQPPMVRAEKRPTSGSNMTLQQNAPAQQTNSGNTKTTMSYTSAIMTSGRGVAGSNVPSPSGSFAAKLINSAQDSISPHNSISSSVISSTGNSRPTRTLTVSCSQTLNSVSSSDLGVSYNSSFSQSSTHSSMSTAGQNHIIQHHFSNVLHINTSNPTNNLHNIGTSGMSSGQQYSLFKDCSKGIWGPAAEVSTETNQNNSNPPIQVDASKAPGYRGTAGCSPVSHSSRTSSHSTSPPGIKSQASLAITRPINHASVAPVGTLNSSMGGSILGTGVSNVVPLSSSLVNSNTAAVNMGMNPIGLSTSSSGNNLNTIELGSMTRNGPIYPDTSRSNHNLMQAPISISGGYDSNAAMVGFPTLPGSGAPPSRLNPRAPDFNQSIQQQPPPVLQHSSQPNNSMYSGGFSTQGNSNNSNSGGTGSLNALLVASAYQQRPPPPSSPPKHHLPPPLYHQSRNQMTGNASNNNMNTLSSMSRWTSFGGGFQSDTPNIGDLVVSTQLNGGCDENQELRKMPPRPIGVERAWKQQAAGHSSNEEWMHYQPPHLQAHPPPPPLIPHPQPFDDLLVDRYQVEGYNGNNLSILPVQCYPPPMATHWDVPPYHHTPDKQPQGWMKWNQ